MTNKLNNLVWLDLEMTGLNPDQDKIIEIATVVSDANLNVIAEGPVIAIHQADELLDNMDAWNTNQHNKSGLVSRVKASKYNEEQAEKETLAFLAQYVLPGKSPMCGNSICQDRRFIYKWMPKLALFFHYRNLDVSTIKILASCWAPEILRGFSKESSHRALYDIYDSIAELRHYREHFFIPSAGSN